MATAISTNVLRQKATQLVFVTETTAGTLTSAPSGSNGATEQSFDTTTAPVWEQDVNTTTFSEIGSQIITQDQSTNYLEYANATYEFMAKPNGASAPAEDFVLKSFLVLRQHLGNTHITLQMMLPRYPHGSWLIQISCLQLQA